MTQYDSENSWVLASGNPGKLAELRDLLLPEGISLRAQSEWALEPVDETGLTFVENALLKARAAASVSGLPALADDSGLVVPALNGQPGLNSARYAGKDATDSENIQCLLANMQDLTGHDRRAFFVCVLVRLQFPEDPAPLICEGRWWGQIAETPKGQQGFGYDPIFLPDDPCEGLPEGYSAAELSRPQKGRLSHRGKALQQLLQASRQR